MIDIESYIAQLIVLLKEKFRSKLVYVGLQGSFLRGEATQDSDIDIMVVIDELNVADLDAYRTIIKSMGYYDKSCGFICSKTDLKNWNTLEIFNLLHSTKDYFGELKALVPPFSKQDIRNFVKLSVNNLYHEICHRYIHSNENHNIAALKCSYKGVFFVLQNLNYLLNSDYVATKAELLHVLDGKNRAVLQRSIDLNNGIASDFSEAFELLFTWCQETLQSL